MTVYRRHILGCKKKWGTARGLIHYKRHRLADGTWVDGLIEEYLAAKRAVIAESFASTVSEKP